jgi:subtilisin family serine protease
MGELLGEKQSLVSLLYVRSLLNELYKLDKTCSAQRVLQAGSMLASNQISPGRALRDLTRFDTSARRLQGGNKLLRWVSHALTLGGLTGIIRNTLSRPTCAVGVVEVDPRRTAMHRYRPDDGFGLVDPDAAVRHAMTAANISDEVSTAYFTGKEVLVSVVDSGVNFKHKALTHAKWRNPREVPNNKKDDDNNNLTDDVHGWNYLGNSNLVDDEDGHGTHVAGIIAARSVDNNAMVGMAYDAKIISVKVFGTDTELDTSTAESLCHDLAKGIRYAADNSHIINLSLRVEPNEEVASALEYAASRGVVVVVAAGNEGLSEPSFPASHESVIAVGSADWDGSLSSFSNKAGTNQKNYVTAPGMFVLSTTSNTKYGFQTGTSQAAPFVSGVVARMLSANSDLKPQQVSDILVKTATHQVVQRVSQDLAESTCGDEQWGATLFSTLLCLAGIASLQFLGVNDQQIQDQPTP